MDRLRRCGLVGLMALRGAVAQLGPLAHITELIETPSDRQSYNLSVPIDHFHNDTAYEPHSDGVFPLRYWFDDAYYKPGGPVILLSAGELTGEARVPYLESGIAHILAEATNGLAVLLEHRYYGTSYPVPDLSLENLRFCSTDQAMADTAYFASNVKYPGLEHLDLTASAVPYIIYGGSYAGAFAALTRKLYPDVYWGGISSSGVTQAIYEYWQYFEAARLFAPGDCAAVTQKLVQITDKILMGKDQSKVKKLKDVFGLGELGDQDFAMTIAIGIHGLQATMWDPVVNDDDFAFYCASISSDASLFPTTRHLLSDAQDIIAWGGFEAESGSFSNQVLNHVGYVQSFVSKQMEGPCKNKTVSECFTKDGAIDDIKIPQSMARPWHYQTCKQWGYYVTGSGVPEDQLPLISRLIDLPYVSMWCEKSFNITEPSDVESINKHGGFNFSYPRLAIVDGSADPWRAATPHAIGLDDRESTTEEPFILVDGGVHHWDEFGLKKGGYGPNLPPKEVVRVQNEEIKFVKAWVAEWAKAHPKEDDFPGEL